MMETNTNLKRGRSGSGDPDTVNSNDDQPKKLTEPTEPDLQKLQFESKDSQILFQEIQNMSRRLCTIETSTTATEESIQGVVASLRADVDDLKKVNDDSQRAVTDLQNKFAETQVWYEKDKKQAKYERLRLESYSRKFNLILEGLPEGGKQENPASLKRVLYNFCSTNLKVKNLDIDVVYRLGPFNPHKPRPTLIRAQR